MEWIRTLVMHTVDDEENSRQSALYIIFFFPPKYTFQVYFSVTCIHLQWICFDLQVYPFNAQAVKNPQWFCKNSCSFIFCLIFKKFSGLYSPMLQLFRFGVSGYIPPSPESAEPTPWLQDGKLTLAFFLWWICSITNIFFPLIQYFHQLTIHQLNI